MTIISSRSDRSTAQAVPVPRGKKRSGSKADRVEPWRDAAILGVLNHAQLITMAIVRPSYPWLLLAAIPFSVTLAIATLTVIHDAGHKRFAREMWPNILAVHLSVPLGFWVAHWSLKHRVHHKASQVYPLDEATRSNLVRMHPGVPLKPHHRYQHVYAWFLYAITWIGELNSQIQYVRLGNVMSVEVPDKAARLRSFLAEKAIVVLILLPYALLMGIWHLLAYVVVAMSLGSVIAAVVLVVGHINEGLYPTSEAPSPKEWSRHLVRTTASFNLGSRPVRWLTGGMTHHLAHHLKPVAPRHELPQLQETVVQQVVARSGYDEVVYPTLRRATVGHYRRLREFGRSETIPVVVSADSASEMPAGG